MLSVRQVAAGAVAAVAALAVAVGPCVPANAGPVAMKRATAAGARGAAASTFTVLHAFAGPDGSTPQGALDLAIRYNGNGNFTRTIYGTTLSGGATLEGSIYTDVIGSNAFATVHSMFGPSEGSSPTGGLASNATDYFPAGFSQLGVNNSGGVALFGTVFATSAAGGVRVVHSFSGGADGGNPVGRMTQFIDGNAYGTTSNGANGYGTIFRVTPSGQFSTVYTFTGGADGGSPVAGLSLRVSIFPHVAAQTDPSGDAALQQARAYNNRQFVSPYLYGTTSGANGNSGTIFRFDPATKRLQTIYAFTGGKDGGSPAAELSSDLSGDLYGTASSGGAGSAGVVFVLNKADKFFVLHAFSRSDGATPLAPITVGLNGNLYGTTSAGGGSGNGNVFRLSNNNQSFTILHDFTGGMDGATPAGKLLDGLDGNVYGTTENGGANGMGVLFTTPG